MEDKELLKSETKKIEDKLGRIYADLTQEEAITLKHEMAKLFDELEDVIVQNRVLPNGMASRLCEKVKDDALQIMGKSLVSSRKNEYEMTKSNFDQMVSDKEFESSPLDELQRFKEDKDAIHKDNNFEYCVDDILDKVVNVYKNKFEDLNFRNAENAYFDIKHIVTRKKDTFLDMHKDMTQDISKTIVGELDNLGITLSNMQMQKVEKQAEQKANDMFETLKSETKTENEIVFEDSQQIIDNRSAFKDNVEDLPRTTTKKDLEAMFK